MRRNKSHKVPNVILRPPPPTTRAPDASPERFSDVSDAPPDASMVDLCPRPFRGFTICATGAMDKPALFKLALELGANTTSDFTDRVTHLVANSHGGAKYLCALERKIPIMTPDWITEAHAVWLRGDDVDVEQGLTKHRLPIFSGVILSLSGIEDIQQRTEIHRILTEHQGTYLKNLERPVKVTHLLCSGDTETDKMKYAEKFNKRKEAHIHLIWEEWFWDCLEFGGRFDERKYQVNRPRPPRKSLNDNHPSLRAQASTSGSHTNLNVPVDNAEDPKRSKAVVSAGNFTIINNLQVDTEEEEMAAINKPVPSVTLQLWQSLLKPRGFELTNGKLVRSPQKSQHTYSPPSTPTRPLTRSNATNRAENGTQYDKEKEKESVISSFRRVNSFAPVPLKETVTRQPFRRNTCPLIGPAEAETRDSFDLVQPEQGPVPAAGLFCGYTFRLLGEARCSNVRLAIENGGGVVTEDDAEESCFVIVRLISGSKLYRDEADDCIRAKYRTECWLEHSVFHERVCEPDENVSFIPLQIMTPVPDSEQIKLSLSSLDQSELCWIRRLIRALGITLEPTFSRRSTHLLCPHGAGAKFDKALEWQIPVVSLAWLENIARTGTIPPVDEYLVGASRVGFTIDENTADARQSDSVRKDKGKGKAKEKDVDCQMMHITDDPANGRPMFVKSTALLQDSSLRRPIHANIIESIDSPHDGLFGKPRFLTHESDPPEEANANRNPATACSSPAPPPLSSSPALVEIELPPSNPTPPIFAPRAPVPFTPPCPSRRSVQDASAEALSQIPTGTQARIPSSTSPSPMKLPPSSSMPNAFASSSPVCLPDTNAIARALHESLTSLLGKRPMPEEDGSMQDVGAIGGKKGKRVRPGCNIPSRQVSYEDIISPPRPIVPPPIPLGDVDMSLLDGLGMGGLRSTEESLRVTYEDPGQAEEKRRLLKMLGEDVGESGRNAVETADTGNVGRARRSKRAKSKVPGF